MPDIHIDAADGGTFSAYLAAPAGAGPAPGILVIQEIWGVNAGVRAICDDYAAQGYLALAPDLFWRQEPGVQLEPLVEAEAQRGFALYAGFSETKGVEDLKSALGWLRGDKRCNGKVAAVGFCLGGKLAYLMATRSDIDASVGYYGVGIENSLGEAGAITKASMLHIAGADAYCSPEAQKKIYDGLSKIAHVTLHTYDGADHAFARVNGAHFDGEAAALANGRTAAFLRTVLGS
jgi:carboxymethylenebutenolidase